MITARDRMRAINTAIDAEEVASRARWAAWFLLPLARLLRYLATEAA